MAKYKQPKKKLSRMEKLVKFTAIAMVTVMVLSIILGVIISISSFM